MVGQKLLTKTDSLPTMNNETKQEVVAFVRAVLAVSKWINIDEAKRIAELHFEGQPEHLAILKQL